MSLSREFYIEKPRIWSIPNLHVRRACRRTPVDRLDSSLKPLDKNAAVTGIYKDDDAKYSLQNLLKWQEGDDPQ